MSGVSPFVPVLDRWTMIPFPASNFSHAVSRTGLRPTMGHRGARSHNDQGPSRRRNPCVTAAGLTQSPLVGAARDSCTPSSSIHCHGLALSHGIQNS